MAGQESGVLHGRAACRSLDARRAGLGSKLYHLLAKVSVHSDSHQPL